MRWLIDLSADGVANMARDEAILHEVGRGASPATLRFYQWSPPTVSLGYFQPWADFAALPPPAGELAVVRRQTGGGAILHDRELTYSVTLPLDHPLLAEEGPTHLYDHVHGAFAALLSDYGIPVMPGPARSRGCSHRGPFFCFERHSCFDLLADGRKLMGSAQRRTRTAVLQQGSLILDNRFSQQKCATLAAYTGLDVVTCVAELARRIAGGMAADLGTFTRAELELAGQLRGKYAAPAWTRKR